MESNHPRSVTPRNSVLKTGKATGPYPSPRQRTYTAVRVSESGLKRPPFRERYGLVHSRRATRDLESRIEPHRAVLDVA